jgi:LysM repeat protein
MTVRRTWLIVAAQLFALLLSTGCGDGGGTQITAETDDPYYVQGVQFKRQGRNPEALTSFLKVIDRRADRGAPESHLQAGDIYLNHIKEPAYAYYHFRRYLELQPNSSQSELVRGMVAAALREFAKTVPGQRANEDQTVRLKANEEISKLQHEVEELRAELAVVRGGGATPVSRPAKMISLPPQSAAPSIAVPTTRVTDATGSAVSPITPAPVRAAPAPATTAKVQSAAPNASRIGGTAKAPTSGGLTHTVKPKESLYRISKQYNVKLEDLVKANGIQNPSNVPVGTVLKIPAPSGGR